MFAIDHILISDEVLDAPFACNLGTCLGECCVRGDSGAPLEPDERTRLEEVLPKVRNDLRPEALEVIAQQGVWEETRPGHYATTCVDGAECVFVTYEGRIARCAIQQAYKEGRVDFPKPISCHLYPLRVLDFGDIQALNYDQIPLCNPARKHGCRSGIQLVDFLREPLVRKYGEVWYGRFRAAAKARREALKMPRGKDLCTAVDGQDTA